MDSNSKFKSKKYDGRLFPEFPLYCEGFPKPLMRGWLHGFCAILMPILGYTHLLGHAKSNFFGKLTVFGMIFGQTFSYSFSGYYHLIKMTPKMEILIQKLDHCGIALYQSSCFFGLYLLLLPAYAPKINIVFIFMTSLALTWHAYNVFFKLNSSPYLLALVGATILPFIPILSSFMNDTEWLGMFLTIFFQGMGMVIFINKWPDPIPSIFGYHEVFHTFVVAGGFSTYVATCSIINRMCN